jgi:hypothetical protein
MRHAAAQQLRCQSEGPDQAVLRLKKMMSSAVIIIPTFATIAATTTLSRPRNPNAL